MTRQQIWIRLILVFYGIVGAMYITSVPIFEASDEAEHFIHIHIILETNALPVIQSRGEMANQTDPVLRWNNQAHHAPLYYMTSALLVSWSERADISDYLQPNELIFLRNTVEDNPNKWLHRYTPPTSDTHIAVYVLRVMNLLIGSSTLLMVFRATQQVVSGDFVPLLTMGFVASIPTFIVVNTSVTNDALVIFLYSTGVYWALKAWRTESFSIADMVAISLILGGIALTKLTGVTLFGVVYLVLMAGVIRQKWTWQRAVQIMLISGIAAALLAGWWYLRNLSLYGDLLAVDATASIWGRDSALTGAIFAEDMLRIGKSFWMLIGYLHNPVMVVDAFYAYAGIMTLIGLGGAYVYSIRNKKTDIMLILLFVCFVVSAMLIYGTLSVDISYGRLLMPAIAAFAPLLILGLYQTFGRFALAFVLPFVATSVIVPLLILPQAYPSLEAVASVPEDAIPVNWTSDTLEIVAIAVPNSIVSTGDSITVDLYFRGNHPSNPAVTITAVDTIRVQRFDHIEIFPGMADMRELPDEQLYKATFFLDITEPDSVRPPRSVNILVEWIDLDTNESLVFDSELSLLEVTGATYTDPNYDPPQLEVDTTINFGDEIILESYSIPETAQAGETINLSFVWDATAILSSEQEAILTMQLFDEEGNAVAQNDGTLWWYPTTRWAANTPFEDTRTLEIPADLAAGDYQIGIGWYRNINETFPRLSLPDYPNDLFTVLIRIEAQ